MRILFFIIFISFSAFSNPTDESLTPPIWGTPRDSFSIINKHLKIMTSLLGKSDDHSPALSCYHMSMIYLSTTHLMTYFNFWERRSLLRNDIKNIQNRVLLFLNDYCQRPANTPHLSMEIKEVLTILEIKIKEAQLLWSERKDWTTRSSDYLVDIPLLIEELNKFPKQATKDNRRIVCRQSAVTNWRWASSAVPLSKMGFLPIEISTIGHMFSSLIYDGCYSNVDQVDFREFYIKPIIEYLHHYRLRR